MLSNAHMLVRVMQEVLVVGSALITTSFIGCQRLMNGTNLLPPFPAAENAVSSLTELSSRIVATYIPFEVVQRYPTPVPEQLQLRIAFWSFPDNEEDIRLYSCLANGSADEFQKGESLYRGRAVQSLLQIGMLAFNSFSRMFFFNVLPFKTRFPPECNRHLAKHKGVHSGSCL